MRAEWHRKNCKRSRYDPEKQGIDCMKKLFKLAVWATITAFLFVLITNIWIVHSTMQHIYGMETIPPNDVALVLGTSKRTSDGRLNKYFVERMNAAASLHRTEKIKHLLVSGDNSSEYYNEPRDMLQALGDLHISETDISLDFAGFRTLDSVVRSREVFGQQSITIVTQEFHCYRALFIAHYFGINAIGYAADDGVPIHINLAFREILARSFAVIDLYILQRRPRFLGEKIELKI